MPGTKEVLSETMLIDAVYGPNDWQFFDIKAKGSMGEIKLGTKIPKLAAAARGAIGQYVTVEYTARPGKNPEYTNYYLEGVKAAGDDIDAPEPVDAPAKAVPSSKDASICRQSGLKCAVWSYGPMSNPDELNEYFDAVIALAERYAFYAQFGPIGAGDDDIPF